MSSVVGWIVYVHYFGVTAESAVQLGSCGKQQRCRQGLDEQSRCGMSMVVGWIVYVHYVSVTAGAAVQLGSCGEQQRSRQGLDEQGR
jgi:hypothetical protein